MVFRDSCMIQACISHSGLRHGYGTQAKLMTFILKYRVYSHFGSWLPLQIHTQYFLSQIIKSYTSISLKIEENQYIVHIAFSRKIADLCKKIVSSTASFFVLLFLFYPLIKKCPITGPVGNKNLSLSSGKKNTVYCAGSRTQVLRNFLKIVKYLS